VIAEFPANEPRAASRIALSIVLPAYNEGAIIESTLSQLTARFPEAEIVLVSDGCADETCAIARSFATSVTLVEYRPNRGKGYAIRRGVLAARGEVVVFTDADLPFGTVGVERLLEEFERRPDADVVIAEKTGAYRSRSYRAARAVVRLAVRWALGLDHEDTQAGLKGFRREAARVIFSQAVIDGFAADMEILAIASREGLRVTAVPLRVLNDTARPSTFTPRQGLRLLRDVTAIRRRLHGRRMGGR
jgi:glycosyltransferase involved in cell wall biosynthesis